MMRYTLILLCVCFLQYAKAKGNRDGVFIGDNYTMIIDGSNLTIKSNTDMHWGRDSQFLTICDITYIGNNFASIKSQKHPSEYIFKDMVVTYDDRDIMRGKTIEFSFPNYRNSIRIFVNPNPSVSWDLCLNWSKGNQEIEIPSNSDSFSFAIENIIPANVDGTFRGLAWFTNYDKITCDEHSKVIITIPSFSEESMRLLYIKQDYILFRRNTIIWQGETYIRK